MRSLEEYIVDMEKRNNNMAGHPSLNGGGENSAGAGVTNGVPIPEDLWTQLRLKDNDLQLAAELGKALLDKNEELKRQQEQIIEEYSKKLEEVEQDRHLQKRKFATRESEYEARILELEKDIAEMNDKSSTKDQTVKQWEKEKSSLLTELTAQNSRLTQQLKESQLLENQLQQQIHELREQCALGKSTLQDHMNGVEGLRDELELMTAKKTELERRLHMGLKERDALAADLEEASQRILLMERHARDQDMRYQQSMKDFNMPQEEKYSMEDRLHIEMDISEPTLSQECMSVYRQLRGLVQQLKTHADDDSGLHSDCSTGAEDDKHFSAGLLSEVAQELVGLVLDSDVVRVLERLEQARHEIQERDVELQRRADDVMELTTKLSVSEAELRATLEERDRARHDASHSSLNQDEVVAKAREVRDQAVSRKNKAEIELAKVRVELLQANSQLMEAIQQKIELSQQLDQWQMDMQELLDDQVKSKLTTSEIKIRSDGTVGTTTPTTPIMATTRRRLLQLFQR